LKVFRLMRMPDRMDRRLFVESLMGAQFMMYHDFGAGETFLIREGPEGPSIMQNALPGIEFDDVTEGIALPPKRLCLVVFAMPECRDAPRARAPETEPCEGVLDTAYRLLGGEPSSLFVSFAPVDRESLLRIKGKVEESVSLKEVRLTRSMSTRDNAYSETDTKQMDLYYESEEKRALLAMLETLSDAVLANGTAYKVTLMIDPKDRQLYAYLKSRLLITEEFELHEADLAGMFEALAATEAIPVDNRCASQLLGFSNSVRIARTIGTPSGAREGDLPLGKYLKCSALETERDVRICSATLNLGTIITGVPGTGKTFSAMRVLGRGRELGVPRMVVISPTEEWCAFGRGSGAYVISLYRSKVPINFFRCDAGINPERFYENLAMLLASASDAGPYRNSLEKCLLAAFSKVYKGSLSPDPLEVYDAVEEAVVERHATRTNVGVKYTKHGENIRASLESLRLMLNRPEFAFTEGVDFGSLLQKGVVFDVSGVSNKMKPFFYALILNQVYCFADSLDIRGNDELRLLICIEEAQLIFGKEEKSAATSDLKQRIQDFRKRGVGIVLIAHNVLDIDPGVRRLCQTKLYFRQSTDSAKYAAEDLLFEEKDKEQVVEKLKTLEHRVCALSYIDSSGGEKNAAHSLFLKVAKYSMEGAPEGDVAGEIERKGLEKRDDMLRFVGAGGDAKAGLAVEVFYAGERIFHGRTDVLGRIALEKIVPGRPHRAVVHGEKKRDARAFCFIAGKGCTLVV
jgi:hypothetical protein